MIESSYHELVATAALEIRNAASMRAGMRRNAAAGSMSILAGNLFSATFILGVVYAFGVKLIIPWLKTHSDHAVPIVLSIAAFIFLTYMLLIWVESRPQSPYLAAPRITILIGVDDSTLEGRKEASDILHCHALNGAVLLTRAALHSGVERPSIVAEAARTLRAERICPLHVAFVNGEEKTSGGATARADLPFGTKSFAVRRALATSESGSIRRRDNGKDDGVPAALLALRSQVDVLTAVGAHHLQVIALGGGALAAAELNWLLRSIEVTTASGERRGGRPGVELGHWAPCTLSAEVIVAPIPCAAYADDAGLAVRAVGVLLGVGGSSAEEGAESQGRVAATSSQLSLRGWRRRLKPCALESLPRADRRFYVLCRT
jgi:hypothetical protein